MCTLPYIDNKGRHRLAGKKLGLNKIVEVDSGSKQLSGLLL